MDAGFFSTLRSFKITSRKHRNTDDDFVDRLNHYHTAILISILSIIICAKQYIVGEPLQCWVPKEFPEGWEKYAESYCWVKNTYFVRPYEPLPEHQHRRKAEIQYYQWVPFVLALQAAMFCVPNLFWKLLNWQSGVRLVNLVEKANDVGNIHPDHRDKNLDSLVRHIKHAFIQIEESAGIAVALKRAIFRIICCGFRKTGNFLTTIYLFTKLLYIGNIVLQFVILSAFLGTHYHFYGLELISHLHQGRDWSETGHFPRVTYCDFKVRSLGQVRPYTIQCVLVINLFNEKIYIFLWFWLVMMLVINFFNALGWMAWFLVPNRKYVSVRKYLKGNGYEKKDVESFVSDMKTDGIFVLKMLSINSGEIIVHDLLRRLFKAYKEDRAPPGKKGDDYDPSRPLIDNPDSWDAPQKPGPV